MNSNTIWIENPTGTISKNTLCDSCARYNSRDVTCEVIAFKDNKVLLIKRAQDPMQGWWGLPGGYLDWDETLDQAAIRELKEETGLEGSNPRLVGVYSDTRRDEGGRQNVGHAYIVEVSGEPKALDEVAEVKWFDLSNLPENIAFDHRKMIEDASLELRAWSLSVKPLESKHNGSKATKRPTKSKSTRPKLKQS